MTIVANNSYRFNMEMDFWALKDYRAEDLLTRWNTIFDSAKDDAGREAAYFLEDCMDVLYEKALILPDRDRNRILDKANHDMDAYGENHKRGVA